MTTETRFHRGWLLLISERWWIWKGSYWAVISKLRFWQSEVSKYWGVLASHGEEGILLWGWQRQAGTRDWFLWLSDGHGPGIWQRFIFFQHAGWLQAVFFLIGYFRKFFQIKKICPHSVDILFEGDIFGQKFSGVLLKQRKVIACLPICRWTLKRNFTSRKMCKIRDRGTDLSGSEASVGNV